MLLIRYIYSSRCLRDIGLLQIEVLLRTKGTLRHDPSSRRGGIGEESGVGSNRISLPLLLSLHETNRSSIQRGAKVGAPGSVSMM